MSDTTQPANPYPSLAALRQAHNDLLRVVRDTRTLPDVMAKVAEFIGRGVATGTLIEQEDDRLTAQSLLDYWSAMIYRSGEEPPDTTLAEFDLSAEPVLEDSQCPYVGLDAFDETRRDIFFGRRRLVSEFLVGRVQGTRLLALVGVVGSGKTSILRAGLLPALKGGAIPGSDKWTYLAPIAPGIDPVLRLAELLPGVAAAEGAQQLYDDPGLLARALTAAHPAGAVLMVDQFEEIFTMAGSERDQTTFVDALVALAEAPEVRHTVLLGMRSDVESFIARFEKLQSWFERGRVQIMPLSAAELREAIERPADLAGVKFEPGLVDRLIENLLGEPGALTLLQFTLMELWDRRDRNRLTWAAYNEIGQGRQAIINSAEALYEKLTDDEKAAAQRVLLRLVRLERGMDAATRRVRRETIEQASDSPEHAEQMLQKLIDARLVRLTPGATRDDDQFELAHEALVRSWPRLVDWMEAERSVLEVRRRLEARAAEWARLGRGSAALLDSVQLAEAERWMESAGARNLGYDDTLVALTKASRAAIEETQQREVTQARALAEEQTRRAEAEAQRASEQQRRAEAEAQRAEEQTRRAAEQTRNNRRLRYAAVALTLMALIALTMAGYALNQATVARQKEREADAASRSLKTETVNLVNAQATSSANAKQASDNANAVATQAALAQQQADLARQQAEEARKKAEEASLAQRQAEIARREAERRQRDARASELAARSQAVFQDLPQVSMLLAIEGVHVSLEAGDKPPPIATYALTSTLSELAGRGYYQHRGSALAVAYDSAGQRFASAGEDGKVLVWDPATPGSVAKTLDAGAPLEFLQISLDGRWLVAAGNASGSARVWDLSSGNPATALPVGGAINGVAMERRSGRLAIASDDGKTYVWSVSNAGAAPRVLTTRSPAISVAVSPDGRWVLTGHNDGIARLWDLSSPRDPISPLFTQDRREKLTAVAFSPDQRWVVLSSADGETHFWRFSGSGLSGSPIVENFQSNAITQIAISADSKLCVTVSDDGTALLWQIGGNKPVARFVLGGYSQIISRVKMAPDGKTLATASDEGTIDIWDLGNQSDNAPRYTLRGHDGAVYDIAISADSKTLASVGADGSLRIWDLSQPFDQLPATADEQIALACKIVGRGLTEAEWRSYVGPEGFHNTCSGK